MFTRSIFFASHFLLPVVPSKYGFMFLTLCWYIPSVERWYSLLSMCASHFSAIVVSFRNPSVRVGRRLEPPPVHGQFGMWAIHKSQIYRYFTFFSWPCPITLLTIFPFPFIRSISILSHVPPGIFVLPLAFLEIIWPVPTPQGYLHFMHVFSSCSREIFGLLPADSFGRIILC